MSIYASLALFIYACLFQARCAFRGFKETLGNACIKWLPMLYYKGSRLNGLGSPLGIETAAKQLARSDNTKAKWPGKPVRIET